MTRPLSVRSTGYICTSVCLSALPGTVQEYVHVVVGGDALWHKTELRPLAAQFVKEKENDGNNKIEGA